MREHLPRWIFASCAKHFLTGVSARLPLHVTPQSRIYSLLTDPDVSTPLEDWAEFKLDGPYIQEPSKGTVFYDIEINTLVLSIRNNTDAYRYLKNIGIVTDCFTNSIGIFKLGDGTGDDETKVGCMYLRSTGREKIVISHFDCNIKTMDMIQSQVEGHYRMVLSY